MDLQVWLNNTEQVKTRSYVTQNIIIIITLLEILLFY